MAVPVKMLLLPVLFFSLLLLMVPSHCRVDPTSTMPPRTPANSTDSDCVTTTGLPQYYCTFHAILVSVLYLLSLCVGIMCLRVMIQYLRVSCYPAPPIFPGMENFQAFSFVQLETITNKFRKRIGSGVFGKVYWGQLSNNRQVAVKRGDAQLGSGRETGFRTEVETLSIARHENIVGLIGYCIEKDERALVYEFISRKDLCAHLHPRFWQEKSMLFSSWKLRVKVLLDVAKGIEYLHKYAEPKIIQRDIKSANILIDENWVAKISDFGIAVFGPDTESDYVELGVLTGTVGYMDPDCNANNLRAIPSHDVYSFGVVMLEVVNGRKAITDLPLLMLEVVTCLRANRVLADFAPPLIRSGNLMDMLDKRLAVPVGQELEAVAMVALLATQCVMEFHQRPDASVIVTELEGALALFHP